MALLIAEPFDHYTEPADILTAGWINVSGCSIELSSGRWGGPCMSHPSLLSASSITLPSSSPNSYYLQFFVKLSASLGGNLVTVATAANAIVINTTVDGDGNVFIYDGTGALAGSVNSAFQPDTWYSVQLAFGLDTAATAELWVTTALADAFAGAPTLSCTGDFVAAASPAKVTLTGAGMPALFDDLLVYDDSGSSFNSRLTSAKKLYTLLPNDTLPNPIPGYADWSKLQPGQHHENMDDNIGLTDVLGARIPGADDGDASGVYFNGAAGFALQVGFDALPSGVTGVSAVVVRTEAGVEASETVDLFFGTELDSGMTPASGTITIAPAAAYQAHDRIYPFASDAAAAWTKELVDSAFAGYWNQPG